MSDKMTCPGCNSHTSGVLMAVSMDEPCPYCGLPAETILRVDGVRQDRADQRIAAELAAAEVRAGRAEAEVKRLTRLLSNVEDQITEWRDTP